MHYICCFDFCALYSIMCLIDHAPTAQHSAGACRPSGQLVSVLMCASLDSLRASNPSPALSDPEVLSAARYLSTTARRLTASRSSLSSATSSRISHLICVLRALTALIYLTPNPSARGPVPELVLPLSPATPRPLPDGISACLEMALDAVLDPMEVQLPAAIRKGPEAHAHTMATCCAVLHSASEAMSMVCVAGGGDVRSRLRGLLTIVARRASEDMGLPARVDPARERPREPVIPWGWDCRDMHASVPGANGNSSPTPVASQLCQQLSMVLAQCAVRRRCDHEASILQSEQNSSYDPQRA